MFGSFFHCWQAAIGSKALDMAREIQDETLQIYGLDVLTLAVLAILTTAPVGALGIGLAGPRLLVRQADGQSLRPTPTVRIWCCTFISINLMKPPSDHRRRDGKPDKFSKPRSDGSTEGCHCYCGEQAISSLNGAQQTEEATCHVFIRYTEHSVR